MNSQTDQIFRMIDERLRTKQTLLMVIEGNAAAGKSRLAALLADAYDANCFHTDDFFLPQSRKTPTRLAEPGGNLDYERFKTEIADRIAQNEPFSYRPFSCRTQALGDLVTVTPRALSIVEGCYSLHPGIGLYPDISLFVSVDPSLQSRRILERNGPAAHQRFLEEWIPMENIYFEAFRVRERCDIHIDGSRLD